MLHCNAYQVFDVMSLMQSTLVYSGSFFGRLIFFDLLANSCFHCFIVWPLLYRTLLLLVLPNYNGSRLKGGSNLLFFLLGGEQTKSYVLYVFLPSLIFTKCKYSINTDYSIEEF